MRLTPKILPSTGIPSAARGIPCRHHQDPVPRAGIDPLDGASLVRPGRARLVRPGRGRAGPLLWKGPAHKPVSGKESGILLFRTGCPAIPRSHGSQTSHLTPRIGDDSSAIGGQRGLPGPDPGYWHSVPMHSCSKAGSDSTPGSEVCPACLCAGNLPRCRGEGRTPTRRRRHAWASTVRPIEPGPAAWFPAWPAPSVATGVATGPRAVPT